MPRGLKGEKRRADAIMIAKITTGEIEDGEPEQRQRQR